MSEGQALYFEQTEPFSQDKQKFPDSVWLDRIDISDQDYQILSEKRPTFNLATLPLDEKTKEKVGIIAPKEKPQIEEQTKTNKKEEDPLIAEGGADILRIIQKARELIEKGDYKGAQQQADEARKLQEKREQEKHFKKAA
jgi:hypothetical protein